MQGLNCDDLPEANIRVASRGRGRLAKQSRHRVKNVRFPRLSSLAEVADANGGCGSVAAEAPPQPNWQCHACTFLNHGLLSLCEVCGKDKYSAIPDLVVAQGPELASHDKVAAVTPQTIADWPALPQEPADPWIECDVSSVASSWLDVGSPESEDDETDGFLVCDYIVPTPTPVPTPAPARPLWSAIVGNKDPGVAPPATEVAVAPPCTRKPTVKARAKIDLEERDIDLDELDARRMLGTKRRHNKKK